MNQGNSKKKGSYRAQAHSPASKLLRKKDWYKISNVQGGSQEKGIKKLQKTRHYWPGTKAL